MRRGVAWVTRAVAVGVLAGAAATAHAQLAIRIDDKPVVEQSLGLWPFNQVKVRLSGPAPGPGNITVNWTTVDGSATAGAGDFTPAGGTVVFAPGQDQQPITIQINGDTNDEWTGIKQDEVFFVQLSGATGPAFIEKGRGTVTLIDDDPPMPGVQFLAAVTGTTILLSSNQARLYWRVPAAPTLVTDVMIRWNVGPTCTFPSSSGGMGNINTGSAAGPGLTQFFTISGLSPNQLHCFSVFAVYSGTPTPTGVAQVRATPFNGNSGALAWSYAAGSTAVVPSTVGLDAIYTVDTGGVVHAMTRGLNGGIWPGAWNPVSVGKPTQNRSAVIPMKTTPIYGDNRLFLGTDGGGVYSIDALIGTVVWSRSVLFGNALPSSTSGTAQAQPAGLFTGFGGANDMLLVGTSNGVPNNAFFALNPATGSDIGPPGGFLDPQMGDVRGMAQVDYANPNRVYFLTSSPSATFYALDLGSAGSPNLTLSLLPGNNPESTSSGTSGSPVLRGGHLLFGGSGGQVSAIDLGTGSVYTNPTGDGQVKGFLWPDRRDDRLYFATTGKVHAWRYSTGLFTPLWSTLVTTPSMVLQRPGTDYLYVGNGNGQLIQINVTTQAQTPLALEGPGVQIGAPSLDGTYGLVIVGSAAGNIHAVRVPY